MPSSVPPLRRPRKPRYIGRTLLQRVRQLRRFLFHLKKTLAFVRMARQSLKLQLPMRLQRLWLNSRVHPIAAKALFRRLRLLLQFHVAQKLQCLQRLQCEQLSFQAVRRRPLPQGYLSTRELLSGPDARHPPSAAALRRIPSRTRGCARPVSCLPRVRRAN